jgi:hypothetical protein
VSAALSASGASGLRARCAANPERMFCSDDCLSGQAEEDGVAGRRMWWERGVRPGGRTGRDDGPCPSPLALSPLAACLVKGIVRGIFWYSRSPGISRVMRPGRRRRACQPGWLRAV